MIPSLQQYSKWKVLKSYELFWYIMRAAYLATLMWNKEINIFCNKGETVICTQVSQKCSDWHVTCWIVLRQWVGVKMRRDNPINPSPFVIYLLYLSVLDSQLCIWQSYHDKLQLYNCFCPLVSLTDLEAYTNTFKMLQYMKTKSTIPLINTSNVISIKSPSCWY